MTTGIKAECKHKANRVLMHQLLWLTAALMFVDCSSNYERETDCDLDKLHVNGNVIKIETIVQSTMPLTEVFANAFDPKWGVPATPDGNFSIDIDQHGNVKRYRGYGIDGKILFEEKVQRTAAQSSSVAPSVVFRPDASASSIDDVVVSTSDNGDTMYVKYFDDNQLIWDLYAVYNDDGTPQKMIKEYVLLGTDNELYSSHYYDTMTYRYLSYDSLNNWLEAAVTYKGIFPRHRFSYKVKRQITYWKDEKKEPLINALDAYNKLPAEPTADFFPVPLGWYGRLSIPKYMTHESGSNETKVRQTSQAKLRASTNYLFLMTYGKNDAYATISANVTPGNGVSFNDLSSRELIYDKKTDEYLEAEYRSSLAKSGTYVLTWLPYQFDSVNGHRALKIRYYRYGNLSPIPVYCEQYIFSMPDSNDLTIMFSFQSNLYNRFYTDFRQSIKSIQF